MWNNVRRCLSVISLIIGSLGTAAPDPYDKLLFAAALGLSNAAIFIKDDLKPQ